MSYSTYFICENIGCSGTTPVVCVQTYEGWEARMGVALFGSTNMDKAGFEAADNNPFHKDFHDNYVSGKGKTKEEAIENMKKDQSAMAESLWY